ncbi:acetylglutamate kinase [Candidatus Marinamargulisbacteria bacterium SCGC AG-410-N11]|nr:acetylglutamate kinase [Candidatus Marinamargulisbacteria bacterium SCGC AG-410-N11]
MGSLPVTEKKIESLLKGKIEKAKVLLEALPYIRQFSGKTIVIKYGGSLMVNDRLKPLFADDITLLKYIGINPIIVHGGGKEISKWMEKMGKKSVFIDGLRVTDNETMEITEMVLSGKINSEVVSLINSAGGKAVGLSGKDANLFLAKRVKSKQNEDLGFVGDIDNIDITLINTLSEKGYIPVISSVGRNIEGETLNMNADHVAERISTALSALKLFYLTDVNGLMIEGELKSNITLSQALQYLKHPDVKEGMLPKLSCSVNALQTGIENVHIINGTIEHSVLLEIFTDQGIGTMLSREK